MELRALEMCFWNSSENRTPRRSHGNVREHRAYTPEGDGGKQTPKDVHLTCS